MKWLEKFIAERLVERVVVESPESVRFRQSLPDDSERRLEHYIELLVQNAPNPLALSKAISLEYEASEHARQQALRPPKTALKWKLF